MKFPVYVIKNQIFIQTIKSNLLLLECLKSKLKLERQS